MRVGLQGPTAWSYIWKSFPVCLALLKQTRCNGLHGPHSLSASRVDQGFGQEKAIVSRVSQLKCERIRDPVPVGPVDRAA